MARDRPSHYDDREAIYETLRLLRPTTTRARDTFSQMPSKTEKLKHSTHFENGVDIWKELWYHCIIISNCVWNIFS